MQDIPVKHLMMALPEIGAERAELNITDEHGVFYRFQITKQQTRLLAILSADVRERMRSAGP